MQELNEVEQKELAERVQKFALKLTVAEKRAAEKAMQTKWSEMDDEDAMIALVYISEKRKNPSLNWIAFEQNTTLEDIQEKTLELGK